MSVQRTQPDDAVPESNLREMDDICDRFGACWTSGKRPNLEQFLVSDWTEIERTRLFGELLSIELEHRRREHEIPQAAEYRQRFPGYEAVVERAFGNFGSRPTLDFSPGQEPISGRASGPLGDMLRIRCPHCHNPVNVVADESFSDVACSSCGSHFSLVDDTQQTRTAPTVKTVGHFELIEHLGMGGFGSVWKARDTELDRTVAVKIPRRGQLPPEEAQNFLREARAAAQLRHPGIVGVHEVGRDGDTVYIVSDLIRGAPLSEWIETKLPTAREAVELCIQICAALHHAHERGIVHRDLKPQNVMLDDDGKPHLMDFGLARREAGEMTMTIDGQLLGTPAYMSPEQARGEAHHADRRSDIYSLGVIMFQLLTGELPFRGRMRMLIHQVLHDDPPSARKLNAAIPRDLETICLKCLEKDPRQRFETAQLAAEDLRRFLDGEPIRARPISAVARCWRWCRRKPVAAALIFLLCVISLLGPLIAARMAMLTAQARQATDAAEKEKMQRERVLNLLLQAFESPNPVRDGRSITVAEVLDRALEQVSRELVDDPYSQANLLAALGRTYLDLGLPQDAIDVLTQARDLFVQELGEDHEATLTVKAYLADAHTVNPAVNARPFIKQLEEILKSMKERLGVDHPTTLESMSQLARLYKKVYRYEDAVFVLQEAVRHYRSTLGEDHVQTLDCMTRLADGLVRAERCGEAMPILEFAFPRLETKLGPDHYLTMKCSYSKADALYQQGNLATALSVLEDLLPRFRQHLGENHPDTITLTKTLALGYRSVGRHREDADLSVELLGHVRRSPSAYDFGLMNALVYASQASLAAGDLGQAEKLARERLELAQREAPDHWATFEAESMLGSVLVGLERFDEAEPLVVNGYQGMIARQKRIPKEYLSVLKNGVDRILALYDAWDKPEELSKWQAEKTRLEADIERSETRQ